MTLKSFNDVMKYIENITNDQSLVIVGQTFDDMLEDKIKVTLIATGFENIDNSFNLQWYPGQENIFYYNSCL